MPRILCVWLPHWPTSRLRRQRPDIATPDRPLATVETRRGQRCLAAIDAAAAAAGLYCGQALADARAICPALVVSDADPAGDAAALGRLALWCQRYTPLAAADPPDGLWLDTAGCAPLFGGERKLAADLAARLHRVGLRPRLALADTPGGAWALAHAAAGEMPTVTPGGEAAALADLPVAALRLDPRCIAGLRRVGVKTIVELAALPRAELTARFGAAPLTRLDQALGRAAEAIAWPLAEPAFESRRNFAEPISSAADLARALDLLAAELCTRLAAREHGAHRFVARFRRVNGTTQAIAIATALPVREAAYIARLLGAKLEEIDPGKGIEAITLAAAALAPLPPAQVGLMDPAPAENGNALAASIDTLASRFGTAAK